MNEPQDIAKMIEDYFAMVTPEQLDADLKACDFDFYNTVGVDIVNPAIIRQQSNDIIVQKSIDEFILFYNKL
jgi:hypothetical protein